MSSVRVPSEVKARVEAKLRECIAIAEDRFGIVFKYPTVLYTKRGRVAGTANYIKWEVNFNSVLLMENLEDFIARTVPHEMAHLVDYQMHPENFEVGLTYDRRGRLRREKRDAHGRTWKNIMVMFGADPSRCHSYDTSNSKVHKRTAAKHLYVCKTCQAEMKLGPQRHRKMTMGMTRYWNRGCGRHAGYEYMGLEGQPRLAVAASAPKAKPSPAKKNVSTPKVGTKAERAMEIFTNNPNIGRKMMIGMFMDHLDMTKAGASTYYANCKKKAAA